MGSKAGLVRLLAVLFIIDGIFGILWGAILAGLGGLGFLAGVLSFTETIRAWGGNAFTGGLMGILVGTIQIIVSGALLQGKRWAWIAATVSAGLSLIHPIVGLFKGNFLSLFGLIIPGVIFYLLTRPEVRQTFLGQGAK